MSGVFEHYQVQKYAKKWVKMLSSVIEYSQNKNHVEVVRNTKTAVVKINILNIVKIEF